MAAAVITFRYFLTRGRGPEQEVARAEYLAVAEHGKFARLPWAFTVLDVTGRIVTVLPCSETGTEAEERTHNGAGTEDQAAA
jgi:hypothetical protein